MDNFNLESLDSATIESSPQLKEALEIQRAFNEGRIHSFNFTVTYQGIECEMHGRRGKHGEVEVFDKTKRGGWKRRREKTTLKEVVSGVSTVIAYILMIISGLVATIGSSSLGFSFCPEIKFQNGAALKVMGIFMYGPGSPTKFFYWFVDKTGIEFVFGRLHFAIMIGLGLAVALVTYFLIKLINDAPPDWLGLMIIVNVVWFFIAGCVAALSIVIANALMGSALATAIAIILLILWLLPIRLIIDIVQNEFSEV